MYKMPNQITPQTIKKEIYSLSSQKRLKLLEELAEEFFPARLRHITAELNRKAKTTSLSKITQITKRIQKQLYGQKT